MRADKKSPLKTDKKATIRTYKRGVAGYSKKTALLEDAITQMNAGKYGRSSAALKELLALDPHNMEARRLFATLHLRLGSLIPARQAFDSLISEAFTRQDYWLAESLLREYLAAGPRCVPFLEKLGAVYQEKGDALEAVVEYGKAIDILTEDPDPDNPHHASQLYAKVRELAPASPVAFRLASLFDAQTGELVARPSVVHGDGDVETSHAPAGEDAAATLSIPEPMAGLMPWEQIEEAPMASDFLTTRAAVPLSEAPVSPEGAAVLSQEASALADTLISSDSPTVERRESGFDAEVEARVGIQELVHVDESVKASGTEKAADRRPDVPSQDTSPFVQSLDVPLTPVLDAVEEAPAILRECDTPHTIVSDPVSLSPLSPQTQEEAGVEAVSAPMPWEHVQESTISIPDHIPDVAPTPVVQAEEASTVPFLAPESWAVGQDETRDGALPAPVTTENRLNMSATEESIVASPESVPDQGPASSVLETSKGGGFSWESVFNSAWKFGDQLSRSVPQPETAQTDTVQVGESTTSMVSSLQAQIPEAESIEIPQSSGEQSECAVTAAATSVAVPMPWDQVQETIVMIPSALVEEPIVESPIEPLVQSTSVLDQVLDQSQADISPTSTALETDTFSITEPPPAPPSSEPEFRFAGLVPVHSVHERHTTIIETEPPSSTSAQVSEPSRTVESKPAPFSIATSGAVVDEATSIVQPAPLASSIVVEQELHSVGESASIPVQASEPPQSFEPAAFPFAASVPTAEVVSTVLQPIESALQLPEETVEPVAVGLPSFSTILSVPVVEATPTDTQPEVMPPALKEENVESAPAPQAVVVMQSTGQIEPSMSMARPAREAPIVPEPLMEAAQVPPLPTGDPAHWKTGEVAVQTHRPSSKKHKKTAEPLPETSLAPLSSEETSRREAEQYEQQEAAFADARARIPEPVPQQEEWIRTGESIRFIEPQLPPVVDAAPPSSVQADTRAAQPVSTVAAAVDVLFESSGRFTRTATRERVAEPKPRPRFRAKLARVRIAISVFISSCFSTTRAIVTSLVALAVLSGALMVLVIGALGLSWIIMEEPPSTAFQSLTTVPQRMLSDSKKNGYLLLLGFDAPAGQDPLQAGYERKPDVRDADMALACIGGSDGGARAGQTHASANVAKGWFRGSDPVGQFKSHQDTIKGWASQTESARGRYKQWQKLSFEDWGYGQTVSPPCASIMFAHQLYLADGFVQGGDIGVDRLETDLEAWRIALAQAKTLPVKTLALQAINDDIAVASGLLVRPDFDGKHLSRVTKMLRPLDQVELSIRWPMQSELVSASKTFDVRLKAERGEEQALPAMVASALPLPKQRRFNDYAEYYVASYKAAGEGRYGSLPKWKNYIRFPANTVMDYLSNPIENVVGLEPLAPWDLYNGLVVDTDAYLRLASLQAWLRHGPQDADLLARIAKAGQSFYDPYTGLPMLVNLKKGVMYSVGHDGKDQDADPQTDVVVTIPVNQAPAVPAKSASGSSKSK